MSHRTRRSVVGPLPLLCLLALVGAGQAGAAAPTTDALTLSIEDVESFALGSSPHLRRAALEVEVAAAGRRSALTWSNPALAYDHEEAGASREWQLSLRKRIERPFGRGRLRDAWDGRVLAADLRARQVARDLVADLEAGYVEARMIEWYLERLGRLAALVDHTADVAASRHAEGGISGLDRRLILLAAYTVRTAEARARTRYERTLASWRTDMGIDASRRLTLTTPIGYRAVDPDAVEARRSDPADLPGDRARVELARALEAQADAARPGLIPGLDVYGGYKRFGSDLEGFVAGVAFDLPLFGAGAGEAAGLRAERLVVENALAVDRTRREGEIATLTAALRAAQPLLEEFEADFGRQSLAEPLLGSYREGAITLDELLGAVQVEAAAMEAHLEDLSAYYANIFRLEALTGVELIDFAP